VEEGHGKSGVTQGVEPYARQWRDLRWRIVLFWLTLATILPGTAIGLALGIRFGRDPAWSMFCFWAMLWMAVAFYLSVFRCPRGRRWFFGSMGRQKLLAEHCLHCGLPRGSEQP
jgi:hypothetical protein